MRTFVAIDIPPATKSAIAALIVSLKPKAPDVRWLAPESIHLTLRFLGDATPEPLAVLQPRLALAAAACPASDMRIAGLGIFPPRGAPRVLWLGTQLTPALLDLQRAVEAAAVECGFPPEEKSFRAHLTLGRWRGKGRRSELPPADLGSVPVDTFTLYNSELKPSGAVHTAIAAFPLRP
jgi:2'-5' RNA ligase